MLLYKDGITHEVVDSHEAARLKKLGYVEVKQPEAVEPETVEVDVPEVKPTETKPAGKKAGK